MKQKIVFALALMFALIACESSYKQKQTKEEVDQIDSSEVGSATTDSTARIPDN